MENELIVIARREDAKKSIYGSLSTFILFSAFLVTDIVFYIRDRAIWQLVLLIISAILELLAILGLLFSYSNSSYSKKIMDTPLITFDGNKKIFVVIDCIFHKELGIAKEDVIEVKISDDGEAYLWYIKDSKKTSTFIGYTNCGSEDLINNEVQKYKNLFN